MDRQDILFKTEQGVFSYRVAGVLNRAGRVLLQRTPDDPGYAFPGGHVRFGETSEQALVREFQEEVGTEVKPTRLLWIGEIFFPWGERNCHQVCLYYALELCGDARIPTEGKFMAQDELEGERIDLEFCWIDLERLEEILVYPLQAQALLMHPSEQVERFVYVEQGVC